VGLVEGEKRAYLREVGSKMMRGGGHRTKDFSPSEE
jgi:hypothetical protein